ncbi:MAG: hypothetical protein ACNS60_11975 [Candidatus Cyclobacteriaceae bacterium M2_1C_046]
MKTLYLSVLLLLFFPSYSQKVQEEPVVIEEAVTLSSVVASKVQEDIMIELAPLIHMMIDSGFIYRAELNQVVLEDDLVELRLIVTYAPVSIEPDVQEKVTKMLGREKWLGGAGKNHRHGEIKKEVIAGFSNQQLQRRAAMIYYQYVAIFLQEARQEGLTPSEKGRQVGAVFAKFKDYHAWNTSAWTLQFNALAKLMDTSYKLSFGRASFTLHSRYKDVEKILEGYDLTIKDYLEWLQANHEVIGEIQGYTMTASIEDDWLIETYKHLPPLHLFSTVDNITELKLTSDKRKALTGIYKGFSVSGKPEGEMIMRIWEEDENLFFVVREILEREGQGANLIALSDGNFTPGWYLDNEPLQIHPDLRIKFFSAKEGIIDEAQIERKGVVLFKFNRVEN